MSINNLRQRIISAYPDWGKWTKLQKQLLLLRSTHSEYWQKDPTDKLSNILITDQYERLAMVAKIFNVKRNEISKAITSSTSFMKALQDNIQKYESKYGEIKVMSPSILPKFKLKKPNHKLLLIDAYKYKKYLESGKIKDSPFTEWKKKEFEEIVPIKNFRAIVL